MHRFSKILVHVDSQSPQQPALQCALELAKQNGAQLHLVDITPEPSWVTSLFVADYDQILARMRDSKTRAMKRLVAELEAQGLPQPSTAILEAPSSVAIIREVLQGGYDLVIKAAKGDQSQRAGFFGTTATRLMRKCPCPVLIVHPQHARSLQTVVAAVSATPEDDLHTQLDTRVIDLACQLSSTGKPHIATVWQIYGERLLKNHMKEAEFEALERSVRGRSEQQLDALLAPFGIERTDSNVHLLHGEASREIPKLVATTHADLLVMGTVARSGMAGLLIGNTAEQILDQVECSVLALKPPGFVSPITAE